MGLGVVLLCEFLHPCESLRIETAEMDWRVCDFAWTEVGWAGVLLVSGCGGWRVEGLGRDGFGVSTSHWRIDHWMVMWG